MAATAIEAASGSSTPALAVPIGANAFAIGRWAGRWTSPLGGAMLLAASLAGIWDERDAGVPVVLLVATAWAAGRAIREVDLVAKPRRGPCAGSPAAFPLLR